MTYPFDSIEFLTRVWKDQGTEGYVALSTKEDASVKSSAWRDYTFPLDDNLPENLEEWFLKHPSKDKYFCPLIFSGPQRSKDLVNPSVFLWSDIDDGDPHKCKPSVLWETSPGRFAGLWKVSRLPPQEASEKSKLVARYIGGDKGGHDLTQVLRIPGTHNGKYPDHPMVKLVEYNSRLLTSVPQGVLDRWRKALPQKLVRIIEGPAEQGRRSDMLWYLEHEMCDLGVPIKDVFEILRGSAWNKYKDRGDEDERFESEMQKIRADRGEKGSSVKDEVDELEFISLERLMKMNIMEPGWLIDRIWMRNSHGIIGGQPKSFKSTLCADMLFSVATGKPFLGREVPQKGSVLVVQNENSDWIMRDRFARLYHSHDMLGVITYDRENYKYGEGGKHLIKGRFPNGVTRTDDDGKVITHMVQRKGKWVEVEQEFPVPIQMLNLKGFSLDNPTELMKLEEKIKQELPTVVVFDPLYLMFDGDINSAKELGPVLKWCLYIKNQYKCAVILVHHFGKSQGEDNRRGGQKLLGSATLHGWIESAWYLAVQEPDGDAAVVSLETEFRGAAGSRFDVAITMSEMGKGVEYSSTIHESKVKEADLLAVFAGVEGGMSIRSVMQKLGESQRRVTALLEAGVKSGMLTKKGSKYEIA